MEADKYIQNGKLAIIAKPNSRKTEITGWDEGRKALSVNVSAPPEEGKANIEIMKFFSRLTKKKVGIVSGKTSKRKLLNFS